MYVLLGDCLPFKDHSLRKRRGCTFWIDFVVRIKWGWVGEIEVCGKMRMGLFSGDYCMCVFS